jgi:predicted DNA-binding protein (UPF0251 family)
LPRPKKQRYCQERMCGKGFKPTGVPLRELRQILLQRDEIEALRLCDRDGLTQQQAGQKMGVSRGTVQRILTAARRKVADALAEGAALVFEDSEKEQPAETDSPRKKPDQ